MSYILDALKKLENEKNSKNRGAGMLNISGELFKDVRRQPPGSNIWKIAAVVVVASLVTFGATWYFLKNDKPRDVVKQHFTPQVPAVRPVSPKALSQQPATGITPQAPLAVPPAPAPVHKAVVTPDVPAARTKVPSAVEKQGKRQHEPKKQEVSVKQPQPVVPVIPSPSDIKVSGIAWQEERSARRAVVNGFLMQEGSRVSGAKIAKIFQDRVRFSQDGRIFEVYLLASGLPKAAN